MFYAYEHLSRDVSSTFKHFKKSLKGHVQAIDDHVAL